MQRRRTSCLAAAVLVMGLTFTGCESPRGSAPDHGVASQQFPFVPVPAGMVLRRTYGESHSIQHGDYVYGQFTYTGTMAVPDVSAYVQDRMNLDAWTKTKSNTPSPDHQELEFRRGKYALECTISREDAQTILRVKVETKEQPKS
jgi:hypothetical protein